MTKKYFFQENLMHWHKEFNARNMPWKNEKDPYKIWLSEIILQQTRVQQGTKYYLSFLKQYPDIQSLAKANLDQILKLWEGLGYYSRARNLHHTAQYISSELNGVFPDNYKDLLQLKGVGPYTAAAIASFAFLEQKAVVDGNVIRVLARFFALSIPYDTTKGKQVFQEKAQKMLFKEAPDQYNQAIMDFGAQICTPKKPSCASCVLQHACQAFKYEKVDLFPIKSKKIQIKERKFIAFDIQFKNERIIEKRIANDVWKDLYQMPMLEITNKQIKPKEALLQLFEELKDVNLLKGKKFNQQLSHQKIQIQFFEVKLTKKHILSLKYRYTRNLAKFAFPKIFILYFESKNLI